MSYTDSPLQIPDDIWANAAEATLPEANEIFTPGFYQVAVMPRVAPMRTQGGIFLPDVSRFAEEWTNYVGQIIALGPTAYLGRKWRDQGIESQDDPRVPKRGEFWCYRSMSPYRMQYKGIKFIALADDSFIGKVPAGCNAWDYKAGI